MKKRRPSAAELMVLQARAMSEVAQSTTKISNRKSLTHSINRGMDERGRAFLSLSIPMGNGKVDQVLDLTFLLGLPNLSDPFLYAIPRRLKQLSSTTRTGHLEKIATGLSAFLIAYYPAASIDDLDEGLFASYIKWQESPDARRKKWKGRVGVPLAPVNCRMKIDAARGVLSILRRSPDYQRAAEAALEKFPKLSSRGIRDTREPTEILPKGTLEAILSAARAEVSELAERMDEGDRLLAAGQHELAVARTSGPITARTYSSTASKLAILVEMWPGAFPTKRELQGQDAAFARALFATPPGIAVLSRYRYACARDLVPFVVLLAIEGAFNSETILGLTWSGIRDIQTIDGVELRISGANGRKQHGNQSGNAEKRVVEPYLALLRRLTAKLDSARSPEDVDRVFVYSPERGSRTKVQAFSGINGRSVSDCTLWAQSLTRFIKRWNLPKFTLKNLRVTLLDAVEERGGAIEQWVAGGQKNFSVVDGHYVGPGARSRDQERLGRAILLKDRWVATLGQIDPRRIARPGDLDPESATPGFSCRRPFDSPQPGQKEGHLCTAFGSCPGCSEVEPNFGSVHAVAYWLELLKQIGAASERLDPAEWNERWRRCAADLIAMIDVVSDEVLRESSGLKVYLPPIR